MSKVVVGMSGGVDSAVAAYLLKEAGHEVIGVTLRTWLSADGQEGRCCEIEDARRAAWKIGIAYHTFNCIEDFKKKIIDSFVDDYLNGLTPNPCVLCNRDIKWERMIHAAKVLEADYVATGHYASVVKLDNGRYSIKKALYAEKDQTYMLYKLSQEQLAATLMPLGKLSKSEVREIALKAEIPVASKPDSQEICFVVEGNYTDCIKENTDREIPPAGDFVDEDGKVLGRHNGIINYTVGQRKGLGIAAGYPLYVKEIRPDSNRVVLSAEKGLYRDSIICRDVNFVGAAPMQVGEKISCNVKIRYHHPGTEALVEMLPNDRVKVHFSEPVRAAAPGQSAVFYDENDCVAAGGIIE